MWQAHVEREQQRVVRTTLLGLAAHAGLRWHQALSAESAGTYKPAAAVYDLADRLGRRLI